MFLTEWLDGRRIRVFADKLVLIRLSLMKSNAEKFFFIVEKYFFKWKKLVHGTSCLLDTPRCNVNPSNVNGK